MRGINDCLAGRGLTVDMQPELDIETIARWAVSTYGADAVPIIRRCAAQNLLADEPEAAECWRLVAEVADQFLYGRSVH